MLVGYLAALMAVKSVGMKAVSKVVSLAVLLVPYLVVPMVAWMVEY